ncbi:MAG: diacylglycerol kinase family protein [Wenzhouxiangellaceae bacterium]|nr:diacylglycerol kinase family protein [Wenzhouxiangellaceae bacterium]
MSSSAASIGTGSAPAKGLAALINPLSFRMSLRDRAERSAERVRAHGGRVREVSDLSAIERALEELTATGIDRLVVAGGDGTLQAAASWLARNLPPGQRPSLIVLSAGRTNYVAGDVGTARHFPATLQRILTADPETLHPVRRVTLKLGNPGLPEQHGFFLAGAMVDEVIRDVHGWRAERPGPMRNHRAASAIGVARTLGRAALGFKRFEHPSLQIDAGALGRLDGPCRFLMLTTLSLEGQRIRPYADRGDGPLRITAVAADAKGWRRRLPRLLTGRFEPRMTPENGYLSGACDNIRIHGLGRVTLDGQEFDLSGDAVTHLDAGPEFEFLRP